MTNKNDNKKIDDNSIKNNEVKTRKRASPVKIAYYVQRMLDNKISKKEILLVISSQFDRKDLKRFANMYGDCFYMEDIRYIAGIVHNILRSKTKHAIEMLAQDSNDFDAKYIILPSKDIDRLIQIR